MSAGTPTLSGRQVQRLMRMHGKTIRGLAASMNITQTRVRYVREHGVSGSAFVMDWLEALDARLTKCVKERLSLALLALTAATSVGQEYPDAEFRVSAQFRVFADELRDAYDENDVCPYHARDVQQGTAEVDDLELYIKCAADSIGELRRTDVFRVLVESNRAELRPALAAFIKLHRPDLAREVDAVLTEEA